MMIASLSLAFFLIPNLASATSFAPQAFPKTVYDAPVIVKGKIGMNYSDWGADESGTKRIYTFYELEINEVLKGNIQGSFITIREFGGTAGGIGMDVPGASHYQRGEVVIVFLRQKNSDESYDVQGMMMGKLNLEVNTDGQETLTGPALMDPEQQLLNGQKGSRPPKTWTLHDLKQLIQDQRSSLPPAQSEPHPLRTTAQKQDPLAGAHVNTIVPPADTSASRFATSGLKSFLVGFMIFMGARLRRSLRAKK